MGGVLALKVLCVEAGGLFLHLLQGRHVFLSGPEDLGEGLRVEGRRGAGEGHRLGHWSGGSGDRCLHGRKRGGVHQFSGGRSFGRLRFEVVGAAEGDGQNRLLRGFRDFQFEGGFVPFLEGDGVAERGQLGQKARQVGGTGAFAARGVQR